MKKLLTLAAALLCTGLTTAQTMMEINDGRRYHAMSENGKYMLTYETGYIGIYNTETNEYRDYDNPAVGYNLGMGNMVTDDGYLVANIDGAPAILDIENDSWTLLGMKDEDAGKYSSANGITPSRKYIVGYVGTGGSLGQLNIKPVIWTQQEDGSYGVYEDLPYPEKDFTGAAPKYILPNWISADGTVIAAQLLMQENNCLPMVYRKAQDGTWTYEVYDKEQREEGLVFPEYPDHEPVAPDYHDYMDAAQLAAYAQDSTEYEDSCWAYQIGESTEWPTYWPDPRNYLTEDAKAQYDADFNE